MAPMFDDLEPPSSIGQYPRCSLDACGKTASRTLSACVKITCQRPSRFAQMSTKRALVVVCLPWESPFASTIPPSTAPFGHALLICRVIATDRVLEPGAVASARYSAFVWFRPSEPTRT